MAIRAKRLLVDEYESNDADFSLKLMEKTTDSMSPMFRGKNGF